MADLDTQIEHARQRLRDLQARAQKQKRKDETRRNIIYGAAALSLVRDLNPGKSAATLQRLHERITRNCDRIFLGLEPLKTNRREDQMLESRPENQNKTRIS